MRVGNCEFKRFHFDGEEIWVNMNNVEQIMEYHKDKTKIWYVGGCDDAQVVDENIETVLKTMKGY